MIADEVRFLIRAHQADLLALLQAPEGALPERVEGRAREGVAQPG